MHVETMKLKAKLQQHLNSKQITTSTMKNKGTEFKAHTHKKDIVLIPQPVSQSQSLDKIYQSTTPEEISHSLTPVTPLLTKYIYSKGNGFLIPTTTTLISNPHQDEIESSDNETQSTPMLKTKRKKRGELFTGRELGLNKNPLWAQVKNDQKENGASSAFAHRMQNSSCTSSSEKDELYSRMLRKKTINENEKPSHRNILSEMEQMTPTSSPSPTEQQHNLHKQKRDKLFQQRRNFESINHPITLKHREISLNTYQLKLSSDRHSKVSPNSQTEQQQQQQQPSHHLEKTVTYTVQEQPITLISPGTKRPRDTPSYNQQRGEPLKKIKTSHQDILASEIKPTVTNSNQNPTEKSNISNNNIVGSNLFYKTATMYAKAAKSDEDSSHNSLPISANSATEGVSNAIITEITEIKEKSGSCCIAAWDIHQHHMIRPIKSKHEWFWSASDVGTHLFAIGNIISYQYVHHSNNEHVRNLPHQHEDILVKERPQLYQQGTPSMVYKYAKDSVCQSIKNFLPNLVEKKYVLSGAHCPSLLAILISPTSISFKVEVPDKLRCSLIDADNIMYDLPVVSMQLKEIVRQTDLHQSIKLWNKQLRSLDSSTTKVFIRLGLSNAFQIEKELRCYLMVNGILFDRDTTFKWK